MFVSFLRVLLGVNWVDADYSNSQDSNDCRNRTWSLDGGDLVVLSWHIHYTTNTTDQPRFYAAFLERFADVLPPGDARCPFGPNFGDNSYKYVCSLEGADFETDGDRVHRGRLGGSPWTTPQRAFFVPIEYIEVAWRFAQDIRGSLDILKHPNTGCMHDDHSVRAKWISEVSDPVINVLEFPCNVPTHGCNDSQWPGPPACGCQMPLASDSPSDSCGGCSPSLVASAYPLSSPDTGSWECSEPPLQVEYTTAHYSGTVSCGNLFLQGDIKGGPLGTAPEVTFASADCSKQYTLLMIDPDADLEGGASWPDKMKPGSKKAPVRHWAVGNIAGCDLHAAADLAAVATTISPFKPPGPPVGSHRYGFFLFEQPSLDLDFETFPDKGYQWDFRAYLLTYGFGLLPVAANWHVTQHTD